MKKYENILFGTLIAIAIGLFFVPAFEVENNTISAFLLAFGGVFHGVNLFILVPFLGLATCGVLLIIKHLDKNIAVALFFVSLISATFFLFPNAFYEYANGLEMGSINNSIICYALALICASIFIYANTLIFQNNAFTVKDIVEVAMFVALAIVLDLAIFKIKIVANGGSISFIMVPLSIIALRKGFIKGFISIGVIFGFISCLLDGYGLFTFPFDYLLGFGSLAILGLFRNIILPKDNKFTIRGLIFLVFGILLGMVGRTIASTISGMIFYELGFIDSLIYQLTYIGPSAAIVVVALIVLYKPILMINKIFPNKI